MVSKAPISVCIIVKNEALLQQCVESFRDYVEEIVIVDTGSTDGTDNVARKLADIFEVYTGCNNTETGLIEDFSNARQRSFELATQPWVMWVDADDIIVGAENLSRLTQTIDHNADAISFMFPYEYSYNELNQCTCLHYRERLFSNKNKFHWVNPVHEVIIPNDNVKASFIIEDSIVFKHQRQYSTKQMESGRNLRILRNYFEKVKDSDPRQMYYLGLECFNNGLADEAIQHLTKYVDISGWDDERAMACLKLVDIYQMIGDYQNGIKWGFKTIEIKETWGEGYFSLAKMFYFLAAQDSVNEMRHWERCSYFSRLGLSLPQTKTLLFINPLERDYEIHRYLNIALNKLGNVRGALESTIIGLKSKPNDESLLLNKKLYQIWLLKNDITNALDQLKSINDIDQKAIDSITSILNKVPTSNVPLTTEEQFTKNVLDVSLASPFPNAKISSDLKNWTIPESWDFNSYPLNMSNKQLQAVVIMLWKQFMLHDEVLSAISFLEKAPYNVRHSFATQKALELTKSCLVWMDDKDDFQKVNAPSNPEVEAGNPLPNKLVMSEGHRFDFVVNNLKPNSKIVDFGCMDGCFTNRYGMLGHKPTGLDVCESSIKLARKKAIEFNTGAEYVCTYFHEAVDKVPNNYFEYATSTDTYEHVKDPVNDIFLPAKKMLKKDGKFLLATPHGAWMRGQYLQWAHPWLWEREGKSWLDSSTRAHIVAPTVWTLAEQFREAGFWVKDCYPDLCDNTYDMLSKEIVDQGNLFAEAHCKKPQGYDDGLDIIFFIGDGTEIWTPKSVEKNGIGGSELMAIEMSKRLAKLGHKVRVYSSCGSSGEGIYDGVEYRMTDKFQDLKCDVLIVSRRADYLGDQYNVTAKLKLLWVHDVCAIAATNELLLKADKILALSEWHRQNLIAVHNLHPDHVILTHNAIDFTRFE
jgi:glycosyltransferase involved in cell wall biosynthesis/2-polyprenyl-3-methyl-5-hydroxy-6-metoxy-1,4-benzoquinol methylase